MSCWLRCRPTRSRSGPAARRARSSGARSRTPARSRTVAGSQASGPRTRAGSPRPSLRTVPPSHLRQRLVQHRDPPLAPAIPPKPARRGELQDPPPEVVRAARPVRQIDLQLVRHVRAPLAAAPTALPDFRARRERLAARAARARESLALAAPHDPDPELDPAAPQRL